MTPSATHLVLIPTYNAGSRLLSTVEAALRHWQPVWVVVDGSTDGSEEPVHALAGREPALRVLVRPRNGGKGAAVQTGIEAALAGGFTHALVMDSDGQHPPGHIAGFMSASKARPGALVLGIPVFGPEAPLARLQGRKLSVGLARIETLGPAIVDPLFGFRVYPLSPLLQALRSTRAARGFDFDPEVAVRMVWDGVPTLNLPAPCRYLARADGGVSHFNYVRDNLKMIWLHARLLPQLLWRWPALRRHRRTACRIGTAALLVLACLVPARAASPDDLVQPAHRLAAGQSDPAWKPLFDALAAKGSVTARFEERRFFPFRQTPSLFQGEMRLSPDLGLSLLYLPPTERLLVIDARGMLMRDARGRTREVPADARAQGATRMLLHVLRFDFAALDPAFVVYGLREGETWQLALDPRPGAAGAGFDRLFVTGQGETVTRLEMRKSATQRVEIDILEPQTGVTFTAEERARFFR